MSDTVTRDRIALAVAGDREAFGELYRVYAPTVRTFIRGRLHNRDLVEDLTSETFLRALRYIGRFTWTGTDIGAWLVTIARHLLVDYIRSSRRSEQLMPTWMAIDLVDDDPAVDPERGVERSEAARVVHRALHNLRSPGQAKCLSLRFLDGLSVAEAAAEMGLGANACKALQHRAIRAAQRYVDPPS
jgi:RNA polymerase sigma-70 factor (ECF subfamily)